MKEEFYWRKMYMWAEYKNLKLDKYNNYNISFRYYYYVHTDTILDDPQSKSSKLL